MKATEILMEEHRVIEGVLEALGIAANQPDKVGAGFFLDVADLIKGFADGCHHAKEEHVLFEALEVAGLPREGGPLGVMLAEHEQGRAFVRSMRAGAETWQSGDPAGREQAITAARGYVELLRAHIYKEDNILFPMADRVLAVEAQSSVALEFERVEREATGEGIHEKYLALAEKLERAVV